MEASITLKKVGKLIGDKTILAGLNFGVERGSLVAIVGVNDSGKTTLLKLLSGFENPNYGQVFIHGLDMDKRRQETRKLLFCRRDVLECIQIGRASCRERV